MDINLNVDLKELDLGDVIRRKYGEDVTLADELIKALMAEIMHGDEYKSLARHVEELRDEEIRKQITPMIAEALENPIAITNTYGEPSGKTTTLREVIVGEAKKYWSAPFDQYSRDKGSKLQALVRGHVDAAFKAEIADAVKAAKEAVASQLGKSVSDVVTEAVRAGLNAR